MNYQDLFRIDSYFTGCMIYFSTLFGIYNGQCFYEFQWVIISLLFIFVMIIARCLYIL